MKSLKLISFIGVGLILIASIFPVESSAANGRRVRYTAGQRAQIRATPILQRPSRPFHFYGNTVRRNAAKSTENGAPAKPVTTVESKPVQSKTGVRPAMNAKVNETADANHAPAFSVIHSVAK